MRRIVLALALAVIANPLYAERIARSGNDEIRLYDSPCVHGESLGRLKEEWRSRFKKLQASIGGKTLFGCWHEIPDAPDAIYVLIEGAEGFAVSAEMFRDSPGV